MSAPMPPTDARRANRRASVRVQPEDREAWLRWRASIRDGGPRAEVIDLASYVASKKQRT